MLVVFSQTSTVLAVDPDGRDESLAVTAAPDTEVVIAVSLSPARAPVTPYVIPDDA